MNASTEIAREETELQDPVISARNVCKAYRSGATITPVLQGVDLEVRRGECVFLVGPSGSGKSTLLSILGCVLSADDGEIRILGHDVRRFRPKEQARFRRERVGFLFQRFHLFRGLRAWENVAVALNLLGQKSKAKSESFRLLEAVGLADKTTSHISQLSMGQRQRVAFARALAGGPDLILADEPTASLDAHAGHNAMQLMRDLAKRQGRTVVVVTHDPRIFPLADRVLHLENGRIAETELRAQANSAFGAAKV
jgi:putative ABC transport system ATP-binding protein